MFQLAVARSIEALGMAGERAYIEGRCPVCGWGVSVQKRADSVYCSTVPDEGLEAAQAARAGGA